jgi:hypothetical protein
MRMARKKKSTTNNTCALKIQMIAFFAQYLYFRDTTKPTIHLNSKKSALDKLASTVNTSYQVLWLLELTPKLYGCIDVQLY